MEHDLIFIVTIKPLTCYVHIALIHQDPSDSPFATGMFPKLTDYSDSRVQSRGRRSGKVRHVKVNSDLIGQIKELGVHPVVRNLVDEIRPTWHNRAALAKAFEEVLACHSQQK